MSYSHFAQSFQPLAPDCTTKFFVPILKEFTANESRVKDLSSFSNETRKKDTSLYMVLSDI